MFLEVLKVLVCFCEFAFGDHFAGFPHMFGGAPVQVFGIFTFMTSSFLTHSHTPSIMLISYEYYKDFDNIISDYHVL